MLHVARSNKSTSSSDILSWQDHLCTKLILIIMSVINEATFSYLSKKFSLSCPSKVAVSCNGHLVMDEQRQKHKSLYEHPIAP